jgi:protein SCO1
MSTRESFRRGAAGLAAVLLVVAGGCAGGPSNPGDAEGASQAAMTTAAGIHDHGSVPAAGEPSEHSLFHLEGVWWDANGDSRRFESLAGRIQILTMAYTHCGYACPRLIADMKRLEGALLDEGVEGVGFVLASFDSERDTPERLARYAEDVRLDPERWTLLGASPDDVMELAAVLGVRYRRESDAEFSHSNLIFVLDPDGRVALRMVLGDDHAEALRVVRSIAAR